ncbi:MAG: beta-Ala-His dipeptidase [Candidatus Lokiarchaeota archaeon]|nr:beta-Ala-His dipeptidase [Candidatus Lokiarchaeota archaeon]
MLNLKDLGQPSEFWEYFEKVSKIPRCSEHEEKIRMFIKEEAERLGFKSKCDSVGNLVVVVPAKLRQKSIGVLQCHMDMVCEKNESVTHDFSKDPLKLKVEEIVNEKWLTAEGTTLGADNGVGICYILTLMKKIHEEELNFDSLELNMLFTIDEEQGLRGAFKIEKGFLEGDFLINLDSEEDNAATIGCAGGLVHFIEIKKNVKVLNQTNEEFIPIKIFISGLSGGHSGVDIHLGRGNALKIIAQLLWKLDIQYPIFICSIDGGNRTNAIPREVTAILYINKNRSSEILSYIKTLFTEIKLIFDGIEPNLNLSIEKLEDYTNNNVLNKNIQENLLNIMYLLPNGPLSMHPRIDGLVFSSSNFGTITTRDDDIEIKISQRSLSEYFKVVIWEKTKALLDLSGLEINIIKDSDYPGWTPNFQSKLLIKCKETYKEIFSEDINIKAIHAGLECGILKKKFPQMEMISIGPTNEGAHSPDERLLIKSVTKVWKFLISLLSKLS